MANLSIKSKLLAMLLAVSVVSIAVVATLSYLRFYDTLQASVISHLEGLRTSRTDQIEHALHRMMLEVQVLGSNGVAANAAREFIPAFRNLDAVEIVADHDVALRSFYQQSFLPALAAGTGGEPGINSVFPEPASTRYLQYHYIANNPFPLADKSQMVRAGDDSAYSRVHERFHPSLKRVSDVLGFADVYLMDIETGSVVYSMNKEPDFATSLSNGVYAHSNLAALFRTLQRSPDRGVVKVVDFEAYRPSAGAPSAFVGTPIFDGGRAVAVLALQIWADRLDDVMTGGRRWESQGLGKSGETYLVGPDLLMRSNARVLLEAPEQFAAQLRRHGEGEADIARMLQHKSTILTKRVRSTAAEEAVRGNAGTGELVDYRGVEVLGSWAPLRIEGLEWGIVAKIDRDEAFAPMGDMARATLIQTLIILLVITMVVMFIATSFVRPVNELIARVRSARSGNTTMSFAAETTDEIGDLGRSFRELLDSLQKQTALLADANAENQMLLENVMPKGMARRVKVGQGEITERIEDVTVVFAELRGLAEYTRTASDNESVLLLRRLIAAFDEVAERYGVERIKTVGDTYMGATGLSQPLLDHAHRTVEFARAVRAVVAGVNREKNAQLGLMVGIGTGTVIADVIGHGRFLFQLWGAAVIEADHAKDCAGINDIVVTRSVHDGLGDQYTFKSLQTPNSAVPLWALEDGSWSIPPGD